MQTYSNLQSVFLDNKTINFLENTINYSLLLIEQ